MGFIDDMIPSNKRLIVLGPEVQIVTVKEVDGKLVGRGSNGKGKTWLQAGVNPRRHGQKRVWLAVGPEVIPWPNQLTYWDVQDDDPEGQNRIRITPELIDLYVARAHKLGTMAAAGTITLADRLVHLGAGAALGMVLTFGLLKLIGFVPALIPGGEAEALTNATGIATEV